MQASFIASPLELVERLRAVPPATRQAMRQALAAHAADVVLDEPGSRAASHLLTTAFFGCTHDPSTRVLGSYRPASARNEGVPPGTNCTCARAPATPWWGESLWHTGRIQAPADVCRCVHCFRLCADAGGGT